MGNGNTLGAGINYPGADPMDTALANRRQKLRDSAAEPSPDPSPDMNDLYNKAQVAKQKTISDWKAQGLDEDGNPIRKK